MRVRASFASHVVDHHHGFRAAKTSYTELVKLDQEFLGKLVIVGFPCNQFGNQEPGSNGEIKAFAAKYNAKFLLTDKVDVNGENAHPLWTFLKKATSSGDIKWNWTKFLVDCQGKPVKRFETRVPPSAMRNDIRALLLRSSM